MYFISMMRVAEIGRKRGMADSGRHSKQMPEDTANKCQSAAVHTLCVEMY